MFDASRETIIAAISEALSSHGPMPEDELLDVLVAGGIDLGTEGQDLLGDILEDGVELVLPLCDERWAHLPALLDGLVFTHRLTAPEAAHDLITVDADLAPIVMLTEIETYQRLTDGSQVADVSSYLDGDVLAERGIPDGTVAPDGALLLEAGRFAALGVAAGDLVALRVTGHGFELTAVETPGTSGIGAALVELLAEEPDEPEMLALAVCTVCADDETLFREPVAPLSELLPASGLVQEGDWIAGPGFDFLSWRVGRRIETIQSRYELTDDEALAVLATLRLQEQTRELMEAMTGAADDGDPEQLTGIVDRLIPVDPASTGPAHGDTGHGDSARGDSESGSRPDGGRQLVRATLEYLAEPMVAAAVLSEIGPGDRAAAAALGLFAESVEPLVARQARPALRWLRAVAHERLGEIEEAEQTFNAAESLDPSWPLTLISLARYASDRGDAGRGLALLRRAGVPPDHELVQLLERFQAAPRSDIGRNQPCWCGSGRKYKVCHLHREQLPLAERAAWLYQKAGADLIDGPFGSQFIDAATARSEHWDSPDGIVRAFDDAIVSDAILFEGGAFDYFLATRGSMLPDDERLLAEQWLLVERSVHEVVSVRRGRGITMRDVRTGDVHEVQERTASVQVKPGELYCARIVPAGATTQIFGGMEPVALGERDALLALLDDEPDPVELVTFLSNRFAPPTLRNTEGESTVLCNATLRVADPAILGDALDQEYGPREDAPDGGLEWFEHVTTEGIKRIRASLTLRGDELTVHANSEDRFERVLATVTGLDPSAAVLSETREPIGDLKAVRRLAERAPVPPEAVLDPATDPALAAAMAQFIATYEKDWLDEPIPALAGRTPRECADDPTRRPDLIRLLDSFPESDDQPGMMSPARLRTALGLS